MKQPDFIKCNKLSIRADGRWLQAAGPLAAAAIGIGVWAPPQGF